MFRRQPGVAERSVGVGELFRPVLAFTGIGALIGLALAATEMDAVVIVLVTTPPFGWAHMAGVRHRWAALLLAGAVGWAVGGLVAAALPDADWADVVGVCVGTLAAVPPYAWVTQVGRPRRARAGRPAGSAPG
jgi:hypothetical protein